MKLVQKKDNSPVFYFLAAVIFVVFLGFTLSGENGLIRLMRLKKVKDGLLAQNRALLEENLVLRQTQKSLHRMETLEREARKSLGWVYPDEVIYVVPAPLNSID